MIEDTALKGNEIIEEAIHLFHQERTEHRLMGICMAVRQRIAQEGHLLFPVDVEENEEGEQVFNFKTLETGGMPYLVAFTSLEEKQKGPEVGTLSSFVDSVLEALLQMENIVGLVINPFGESICLDKDDITVILNPGIERFV